MTPPSPFPSCKTPTYPTAMLAASFSQGLGLQAKQLRRLLLRAPWLLGLDLEKEVRPAVECYSEMLDITTEQVGMLKFGGRFREVGTGAAGGEVVVVGVLWQGCCTSPPSTCVDQQAGRLPGAVLHPLPSVTRSCSRVSRH